MQMADNSHGWELVCRHGMFEAVVFEAAVFEAAVFEAVVFEAAGGEKTQRSLTSGT